MQEIHCVPEIVSSLLCKVQLLFLSGSVHSSLHSPSLNCYSCGIGEYTLCALVCRHLQHKSSVISVDSGNTLYLKMQNRMRIQNVEVDDATVCLSISVSVRVWMHLYMCLHACIFIVHAGPEAAVLDWYGPEADPGYWQGGKGDSR